MSCDKIVFVQGLSPPSSQDREIVTVSAGGAVIEIHGWMDGWMIDYLLLYPAILVFKD